VVVAAQRELIGHSGGPFEPYACWELLKNLVFKGNRQRKIR